MARKFVCTRTEPVVQTKAGKLRGFQLDTTYIFQGIHYAEADRFQMPRPVEPWEGVKDALSYGFVCPLMQQETPNGEVMVPHRYWPMDEHCQNLNIWTQSLDPQAKKPVLVWLHGGGFFAGSSIEQQAYDGENMSRFGDVVVVSLNHRLNLLGYLDLEPFGEKYWNSCNAGNADMVAALRWIHENIAQFGGDPENVTLFGQSGGGMKVWTLMQTPEADGLFQKGIVQSGLIDGFVEEAAPDGRKVVTAMLEYLGLTVEDVEQLETLPYARLAEAYQAVTPALEREGVYVGGTPAPNDFYVGDPRQVGFTDHAKTIPLMVGTVFGEFAFAPGVANKYQLSQEEKVDMIRAKYGEAADRLIPLFQKAWPEKDLCDLLVVDSLFRFPTQDFIQKKAACPESKTFSYVFAYEFPFDGGKPAWHCSEIPFVFHNSDKVPVCNEPGVSDLLEERVFGAWIAFARQGDPSHPALPQWPACTPGKEQVMIFDKTCQVRENFDWELVAVLRQVSAPWGTKQSDEPIQH